MGPQCHILSSLGWMGASLLSFKFASAPAGGPLNCTFRPAVSGVASEFWKFFSSVGMRTHFWCVGSRWQPEGAEKVPLGFVG